jgi:hypothetical protein
MKAASIPATRDDIFKALSFSERTRHIDDVLSFSRKADRFTCDGKLHEQICALSN